jgi:hypothetical protein
LDLCAGLEDIERDSERKKERERENRDESLSIVDSALIPRMHSLMAAGYLRNQWFGLTGHESEDYL